MTSYQNENLDLANSVTEVNSHWYGLLRYQVNELVYRKIPLISPGLLFVQKAFLVSLFLGELSFGGAYYNWREFCISKLVGLDNKNRSKDYENNLKQLKIANPNSPWSYIWEGLWSEGCLRLRFGGLIFGRAYFWVGLLSEFYGISRKQIQSPRGNWGELTN